MTRPIHLVHAAARSAPDLDGTGGSWLCLVSESGRANLWEDRLSSRYVRLDVARRLDETASRLRPVVIEWLDELGRAHAQTPQWWTSTLSERNAFVSPFFLHVCYLAMLAGLCDEGADLPVVVVAEDWGLIDALTALLRERGLAVVVAAPWQRRVARLLARLRVALSPLHFLLCRAAPRAAAAWWTRPRGARTSRDPAARRVLLKTAMVGAHLSADGVFRDRNFAGLYEFLSARGIEAWVVPVFIDSRPGPLAHYRWMRRSSTRFVVADDWLRFSDYVVAVADGLRLAVIPRTTPPLAGFDVQAIVASERWRQAGSSRPKNATLMGRLPGRLAAGGFRVDEIVAWSENQAYDKTFAAGCRAAFNGVPLVTVQNYVLPPNLLNLFPTAFECESGIVGDVHVCSGPLPSTILKSRSGGRLTTVVGCGLRYRYLWNQEPRRAASADAPTILIMLNASVPHSVEILNIVAPLAEARPRLAWLAKAHPICHPEEIRDLLPESRRGTFTFVEGTSDQWLRRAACVITMGSGTALEASILGVPLIQLGSRGGLNFDSMAWHDETPVCFTLRELGDTLDRILSFGSDDYERLRRTGERLRSSWFAPVTEQGLAAFVLC